MLSGSAKSASNPLWKGKAKEDTSAGHFVDLNPTITYRHILSQNLGVRDPLRVVALCDSDAFYAACEMVRLGVDKETPLVVLQWESLIAVNYAARKYGISRMCKKKDALKMCPQLQVVHVATYKEGEKEPGYWDNVDTNTHKVRYSRDANNWRCFIEQQVSLDYYRRESLKIAALFRELLPGCEVGE
jgi:DNA polymerase eta